MADKLYGYVGKILRVNLSTGEITTFSSEKYQDMYLGGKGWRPEFTGMKLDRK